MVVYLIAIETKEDTNRVECKFAREYTRDCNLSTHFLLLYVDPMHTCMGLYFLLHSHILTLFTTFQLSFGIHVAFCVWIGAYECACMWLGRGGFHWSVMCGMAFSCVLFVWLSVLFVGLVCWW